ncbi:PREDICTED: uncharacterized protein LOC106931877 isoform X2 [Poecilia mexicana]|uniref:uncharacterized protein LOC106931877 isoform X2 n=1 Tax=Poecilia mexicana TaxID=48701 RepID=UPI00072EC527|nr:PREDICTED: uncharacterized protein LOC106931877 isoform X2 [Poecilia mexicana]
MMLFDVAGQQSLPPLLSEIPSHLFRVPGLLSRRRCRRRRGSRVPRHFLDPVDVCLVPVVGVEAPLHRHPCPSQLNMRRQCLQNLRPLCRVSRPVEAHDPVPVRIGLVNARSLGNKTFILRDFFSHQNLDFLCVTETWLSVGESSALSELLPADCSYFNSPRASGRGGGTATVYKQDYKCKQCFLQTSFPNFEFTSFEMRHVNPVFCAVVYRPPKYNKDFISDFSDFLSGIITNYEHVLIVGDFNIHVCCPDKPLVKDFLSLLDSFNLVQAVSSPTHEHRHTLDLVISCGLPVTNLEICDSVFSDHLPVLFSVSLTPAAVKTRAAARANPSTATQFSTAFLQLCGSSDFLYSYTEELWSWFYSSSQTILDSVAPLKTRQPKIKPEPWFNDRTRAVRKECRRVERRWKKDKLQVTFQIVRLLASLPEHS